jgi:PPOX class probable FMN-dependent enzyme
MIEQLASETKGCTVACAKVLATESSGVEAVIMIESIEALRQLYSPPGGRALQKQLTTLEKHSKRFIELAPFLVIASANRDGIMDASPRGGDPGFIKVQDDHTILIPDSPGNNRLDSLSNILDTGQVGLIFFIPGVDETLRINGAAVLNDDPALRQQCADTKRVPKLVIQVTVAELYLHCAKALMRSALWATESRIVRSEIPSIARMVSDQIGYTGEVESQEQMVQRYAKDL